MKKLLLGLGLVISLANSQTLGEKLDKNMVKLECKNLAKLVVGVNTDYNLARAEEPKVKLISTKIGYLGLVNIKIDHRTFSCVFRKENRRWKILELWTKVKGKQISFIEFYKFRDSLK